MLRKFSPVVGLLAACFAANVATAASFNFTGNIGFHNDIVQTTFTLDADATNVRIWTDSYQDGVNFDPITALWDADGNLVAENDDDDTVNPATQTIFDSGFTFASLSAGEYIFTIATFDNFVLGTSLSDGFAFSLDTPIAMSEWCQPASDCDMGTNWSVWLDGVDDAIPEVPVPAAAWLFGSAILGLIGAAKRKKT